MSRRNEIITKINTDIGIRIKKLRVSKGLTQARLGKKIDVSHQQLKKYEDGSNHISAGRLWCVAKGLQVSTDYFFAEAGATEVPLTQHSRMAIEVSRNFMEIKDSGTQFAINELVKYLSRVK